MLCLVIDNSGSMYNNGLEKAVVDGLELIKETVSKAEERKYIQTSITLFGYKVDMRPFKDGEHIDTSYEAKGYKTRLYGALVESCNNMICQYDYLEPKVKVKGTMFLFTDGEESGSEKYDLQDVKQAIKELEARMIKFVVVAFEGVDSTKLANDFGVEPILIKDYHQKSIDNSLHKVYNNV